MRVDWCVSSWFRIKNTHTHTHTLGDVSCLSHPHCRRMRGSCFLSPYSSICELMSGDWPLAREGSFRDPLHDHAHIIPRPGGRRDCNQSSRAACRSLGRLGRRGGEQGTRL